MRGSALIEAIEMDRKDGFFPFYVTKTLESISVSVPSRNLVTLRIHLRFLKNISQFLAHLRSRTVAFTLCLTINVSF